MPARRRTERAPHQRPVRGHRGPRRDPRQAEADAIAGRGGDDLTFPDRGNDEIAEGDGAIDDLHVTRDVVGCGPGKDTVLLDPDDEAKNGERINPT